MQTLTDTLVERVDKLVQARKAPLRWGSPRLSVTPTSIAIQQLAVQVEALQQAVREIALDALVLLSQEHHYELAHARRLLRAADAGPE